MMKISSASRYTSILKHQNKACKQSYTITLEQYVSKLFSTLKGAKSPIRTPHWVHNVHKYNKRKIIVDNYIIIRDNIISLYVKVKGE